MDATELVTRFRRYPTPSLDASNARTRMTCAVLDLAAELNDLTPDSREKSLAMTSLEEALMWAIKAIERNGVTP